MMMMICNRNDNNNVLKIGKYRVEKVKVFFYLCSMITVED